MSRGYSLHPYTSSLSITVDNEMEDDEAMGIDVDNETAVIVSSSSSGFVFSNAHSGGSNHENSASASEMEVLNLLEKREAEIQKQVTPKPGVGSKRVNLDNMGIPMAFQKEVTDVPILLTRTKKSVCSTELHVHLTEDEKHRLGQQARYQERENRRIKKKALELHNVQMTEGTMDGQEVETIRNDRIPVCPQSREQRRRRY